MNETLISAEVIETKIIFLRDKKVILDQDLALLYQVPTKSLNLAVKRNQARFPEDFIFQLTKKEYQLLRLQFETSKGEAKNLKSQNVISSWGGRRYLPYVFTEQGIAMLSSVLNSARAISVNIQIMRTFVRIRELLSNNNVLREKVEAMEKKYDSQFQVVFQAIKRLLEPPSETEKKRFGFLADNKGIK